jgi:uncharacterized protein HemY
MDGLEMPHRILVAYIIIAVMAAVGLALFFHLSREWRAHRRDYMDSERTRRAKTQARRRAERDALRGKP